MKNLTIEGTAYEPNVELNVQTHTLIFRGESRPEDVKSFFIPIFIWLENYLTFLTENKTDEITCTFKLEYFNSASSKSILDVIEKLAEIQKNTGTVVVIKWFYDSMDEDMKEAGEEFQLISDLKFTFYEVE